MQIAQLPRTERDILTDIQNAEAVPAPPQPVQFTIHKEAVTRLTAELLLRPDDPVTAPTARAQLEQRMSWLKDAEAQQQAYAAAQGRLPLLKAELQELQRQKRRAVIENMEAQLSEARAEYKSMARDFARKWREIEALAKKYTSLTGSGYSLPDFDIACLNQFANTGFSTSDQMQQGLLVFEQLEKDDAERQAREMAQVIELADRAAGIRRGQ